MRKRKRSAKKDAAKAAAGTAHGAVAQPAGERRIWLYGAHVVRAALLNPKRTVYRLLATSEAARRMDPHLRSRLAGHGLDVEVAAREELAALLPADAVHQGLALEVSPLGQPDLDALIAELEPPPADGRQVIVALDQVTDPQNAGAVLRSAAAFGAAAVVTPRHGQAPETAALAKAASGALEHVPYLEVGNLARALAALKKRGFWVLGLAADGSAELAQADPGGRIVLVLGAEGKGLRRLIRESCDLLVRLPTRPPIDQLNVSNAAAVALYELLGRSRAR